MQIELPDQTIRDVQAMLAKRDERTDISQYVDRTLQRALFFDTVREIKSQNAGVAECVNSFETATFGI